MYFNSNNSSSCNSTLWIDCAWRLRKHKSVQVGSLDEPEFALVFLGQLVGQFVLGIAVSDDTWDLKISFGSDLWIETFGYSVADEHWELRRDDGLRFGTGPQFLLFNKYIDSETGK